VPSDLYRYADAKTPAIKLRVNGRAEELNLVRGYARLERAWKAGDKIQLSLEMPIRQVEANAAVKADRNRFAIERGPLVYCAEGADNTGGVLNAVFSGPIRLKTREWPKLLGGITTLEVQAKASGATLTCIPYYAWCTRGPNEMRVWFPTVREEKLASTCWEQDSIEACFDGKIPARSNDASIPRFTWWDHRGSSEWIVFRFDRPKTVAGSSVYWFDDSGAGSCRVPRAWKLSYLLDGKWKPVLATGQFAVQKDQFNRVAFEPVRTEALRLEAELQPEFSGGILEWRCE